MTQKLDGRTASSIQKEINTSGMCTSVFTIYPSSKEVTPVRGAGSKTWRAMGGLIVGSAAGVQG